MPGMIERARLELGQQSSRPGRTAGPEPSQRMSLAIFIRLTATVLQGAAGRRRRRPWRPGPGSGSPPRGTATPVSSARRAMARRANSGWVLMPVPTAVPPSASSRSSSWALLEPARCRARPGRRSPENSWPRRIGVASCRWVRPILMTSSNSWAFCASGALRAAPRPGMQVVARSPAAAATWMAVGMTSLDDWPMLTWSLGWTGVASPCCAAQRARWRGWR